MRSDSVSQPNILFILVDDMGYSDLGSGYAGSSVTPNLDQYAADGVTFSRNYVDSTCAATRAGILSGLEPARLGFRPGGSGISPQVDTLADLLRAAGYSTHHVGKWHLGFEMREAWPLSQGFDSFFGFLSPFLLRGPHRDPRLSLRRPTYENPWLQEDNFFPKPYKGHLSDLLLERVLDFLGAAKHREEPWFLNYWLHLPHTPLQPSAKFRERFGDTPNGLYQASLAQMDSAIGEVLTALERNDLAEETLVVFVSDNGGTNKTRNSNLPFAGAKMSYQEGGVRTPLIFRWPDKRAAGTVVDEAVSYLDYLPTLVNAAGGSLSGEYPGRNIAPLVKGQKIDQSPLFWEATNSEKNAWSMLSKDGMWRLHRFFGMSPELNDLRSDPAGRVDVAKQYPKQLDAMWTLFRQWRMQARRVQITVDVEDTSGSGIIKGETLQRTPLVGGFTFAVGVMPRDSIETDGNLLSAEQIIAEQEGVFALLVEDEKLKFQMGDISLEGIRPSGSACQSIVLTLYIAPNYITPGKRFTEVALYLDGKKVGSTSEKIVPSYRGILPEETYLGRSSDGSKHYGGKLLNPVILNERVVETSRRDPWLDNGVDLLHQEVCAR